MEPRRNIFLNRFILIFFLAVMLAGCSDSPTEPESGGGPEVLTDIPEIPQPATLGGDVPSTSATLTRIELLGDIFRPNVLDAYGSWEGVKICNGEREYLTTVYGWSTEVKSNLDYVYLASLLPGRNIAFQDNAGAATFPVLDFTGPGSCSGFPVWPTAVQTVFRGAKFGTAVHVRRDRRWKLKPLEGNAGDYLLVYPQTTGMVSSSYTSGTERSQTEEFGKSLTVGAEAGYGPLSASVEGTLSETFSSSVTVSESKEETFTKTVTGKPGKVMQFMVWELVETYSFCDAEGNPLVSEDYLITHDVLTRHGSAVALQSTEFDLPQ